jgi:hypothetical protein
VPSNFNTGEGCAAENGRTRMPDFEDIQMEEVLKIHPATGESKPVTKERWKCPPLWPIAPWQKPGADKPIRDKLKQVDRVMAVLIPHADEIHRTYNLKELPPKVKAAIAATEQTLWSLYNLQEVMEKLELT